VLDRSWFVTGGSRGLGRAIVQAALARGDRVAAASRRPEQLDQLRDAFPETLVPLELDVTDSAAVDRAFAAAVARFGGIDVVVNNAGYVHVGAIEELTDAEARAEIDILLFGPFYVTRAAVRHMRPRGRGTIVQMSSLAGIAGLPGHSLYAAGKWALEGMTEAARGELAPFGIRLIAIEPGGFRTTLTESVTMSAPNPAYDDVLRPHRERYTDGSFAAAPGDPARAALVILELVDSPDPPKRLVLGDQAYERATATWRSRVAEAESLEHLSRSTNFADG
jgi:NAD(P)-dependent dehydrogenase (short-subunit alcohol dehydrogenase family)